MNYLDASKKLDTQLLSMSFWECGEPLVSVGELCQKHHVHMVLPGGKNKTFWLRKTVALALIEAAKYLYEKGFILVLEDAYRSLLLQKENFLNELANIKKTNPGISETEANQKTNMFVAGIPILAAHTAGAAVDVTLAGGVDMGCPYLTLSEEAVTDYPYISIKAKKNRKILFDAMEKAGFTNYPFEYWHFSLGDVCDAYIKKKKSAIYGPVFLDETDGVGIYPLSEGDCYKFFSLL